MVHYACLCGGFCCERCHLTRELDVPLHAGQCRRQDAKEGTHPGTRRLPVVEGGVERSGGLHRGDGSPLPKAVQYVQHFAMDVATAPLPVYTLVDADSFFFLQTLFPLQGAAERSACFARMPKLKKRKGWGGARSEALGPLSVGLLGRR